MYPFNGTASLEDADIEPIPELFREDADLLLFFLVGNGVEFEKRNFDPWYRGMVPGVNWSRIAAGNESYSGYDAEEAASPLGCLQRYQYCSGHEKNCGPMTNWLDVQVDSAFLFNLSVEAELSPDYRFVSDNPVGERYQWFTAIIGYVATNIMSIVSELGTFSLASQQYMDGGWMGALPDNQWQLDVEHWWSTWLAAIQASVVTVAVGISEKDLQPYKIEPISSYIQDTICDNQVSPGANFSVLALLLCLRRSIPFRAATPSDLH